VAKRQAWDRKLHACAKQSREESFYGSTALLHGQEILSSFVLPPDDCKTIRVATPEALPS
jgi:hypothetical protein